MNFEVFCFDYVDGGVRIVQKEYFDTYAEAFAWEINEGRKMYEYGVDITPMNEDAYNEMVAFEKARRK